MYGIIWQAFSVYRGKPDTTPNAAPNYINLAFILIDSEVDFNAFTI